jgi:hypothetical protein
MTMMAGVSEALAISPNVETTTRCATVVALLMTAAGSSGLRAHSRATIRGQLPQGDVEHQYRKHGGLYPPYASAGAPHPFWTL